jgi:hypothetical protein
MRGRKHFLPHAMSRESSGILCDWDVSNSNSPEYSSSESSGSFSALTAALSSSAIPLSTVPPPSTSAQARPISAIHSSRTESPTGFWEETDMVAIFPGKAAAGKKSDGEWDPPPSEVCAPPPGIFGEVSDSPPPAQRVLGQRGRQAPSTSAGPIVRCPARVVLATGVVNPRWWSASRLVFKHISMSRRQAPRPSLPTG